jgi:hypothetical protein
VEPSTDHLPTMRPHEHIMWGKAPTDESVTADLSLDPRAE